MKKLIICFIMITFMLGCNDRHTTVVETSPQPVVVAQPVYVKNPDPMTGVIAGMAIGALMSNGMRYDGHNGYYDNRYNGPPRTIVNKTTINKTVINNATPNSNNSVSSSPKPVVAVGSNIPTKSIEPVKTGFSARPASAPIAKTSFSSRPVSKPSTSSSFSSRRK